MRIPEEYNTKIDIELLKKDVSIMATLFQKMDSTLERLQEIASSLSKMISLQEQRIESQGVVTKEVQDKLEMRRMEHNDDIKELHSRITTVNRELTEKIENTEKAILSEINCLRNELRGDKTNLGGRIREIEMWKWMITGGVALIIWGLSEGIKISKFFG